VSIKQAKQSLQSLTSLNYADESSAAPHRLTEIQLEKFERFAAETAAAVEAAFASHATHCQKLKDLKPMIAKMRQIFEEVRKLNDDRITVASCSTWTQYCENVLHRSDRCIRKLLAGDNPGIKYANKTAPLHGKSTGSLSYVTSAHPQFAQMQAAGLITGTETAEKDCAAVRSEKVCIKRQDGSIIPEAAYSIEDATRQSIAFVQSSYRFLSHEEQIRIIDRLITILQTERGVIVETLHKANNSQLVTCGSSLQQSAM